ncbi:hypothetical protein [Alloprevotella tannerae]|uniref:hypothetical protein n=1 Tax=Alloprevotella tannerae TaxID=76122 RepID=UPI001EDC4A71|nr:hypothetical protein [Alloprevotella tannerae]MCG2650051.1 hypothetical protein [Alloprevotella tannerae]
MSAIQPSKLGKAHNTTNSFSLFFAPRRRPKQDDSASASAYERGQSIGEESRLRRRGKGYNQPCKRCDLWTCIV